MGERCRLCTPRRRRAALVADLLDTLERRRGQLHPGEQQRLVAQLKDKAEEAGFWLTRQQRGRISAWDKQSPLAPTVPTAKPTTSVTVLPAAAVQAPAPPAAPERRTRGGPRRTAAPTAFAADADAVADAARDVVEHTARVGTTIGWDRLCAQARTVSWLTGYRRLHRRCERKAEHLLGFVGIAAALSSYRRLTN